MGEPSRRGLTLLELAIVLIILAALTTVAVRSLGPVADQARYEKTQQTLIEIEQAILLRSIEPGGIVSYSGFVADMGRLPRRLDELWRRPQSDDELFQVHDVDTGVTGGGNVRVVAGWKGPYLLLPPGMNPLDELKDGFGNGFIFTESESVVGHPLIRIESPGSGIGDLYDRLSSLPRGFEIEYQYRSTGDIEVFVRIPDGDPPVPDDHVIEARLFGPQDGRGERFAPVSLNRIDNRNFYGFFTDSFTAGPYKLWAFSHDVDDAAPTTAIRQTIKSQIMIVPGANTPKDLILLP